MTDFGAGADWQLFRPELPSPCWEPLRCRVGDWLAGFIAPGPLQLRGTERSPVDPWLGRRRRGKNANRAGVARRRVVVPLPMMRRNSLDRRRHSRRGAKPLVLCDLGLVDPLHLVVDAVGQDHFAVPHLNASIEKFTYVDALAGQRPRQRVGSRMNIALL